MANFARRFRSTLDSIVRLEFLEGKKDLLSVRLRWLVLSVCAIPVILNLFGVDFGLVNDSLNPYQISHLLEFESQRDFQDILRGRYVHAIFVSIGIAISFLTILLAFIDFRIKRELSTPILGVALFCSGLFNTFHLLVATRIISTEAQQFYFTAFTWFFCRIFNASILILGTGLFLVQSDAFRIESQKKARRFVLYISVIFILLTCLTITILFMSTEVPRVIYPYRNIARSYDLIPLFLYAISGLFILPKFYQKYPSIFSQTLIWSMIPAAATQLYMAFGSNELFDNAFNISHFLAAFTYFIPFLGLTMNYLQTHKNEQLVIGKLHVEVSDREHAEKTLSGVLFSSLSSIMAFSAKRNSQGAIMGFTWTLANPAVNSMFKWDYENLPGKNLSDIFPAAEKEGWISLFTRATESGEEMNQDYYSPFFKKWLLMICVKLEDGVAVTISDISKRKNAQQELMTAERLAVTGRISRTIAHEIRNPLTNINLSLDQLKSEFPSSDGQATAFMEIIRRNSERINQLISELLYSSKPAEIQLQAKSIQSLLDETIVLAADRLHLKSISLAKDYPETVILAELDPDKMKIAILNIIINAIEAMEANTGQLKIRIEKEPEHCLISISDNGCGIPEENIEHLFDPFFSGKQHGTGLGLAATQNIIRAHHGKIEVDSIANKGTTFKIWLPLKPA